MTDEQWAELGRRAVACKGWRWMPGMKAIDRTLRDGEPLRVSRLSPTRVHTVSELGGLPEMLYRHRCDILPDLRDPATVGCLQALVREAWGRKVWVRWWRTTDATGVVMWCEVVDPEGFHVAEGERPRHRSEAEALVAALEAAP